jgi:GNAT superfamily N-acetyltransferase
MDLPTPLKALQFGVISILESSVIERPPPGAKPRGSLQRPKIELEIFRVHYPAWELFRKHHYLDTNLNRSAICFVALWQNIPVAFSAWLPLRSGTVSNGYREHRTVTLPDFQGVGIGNALSACCASMWRGLGKRVFSATSHPSMISTRERSPLWRATRSIQLGVRDSDSRMKHAMDRMTAGFEYIGEMMPPKQAQELLSA